MEIFTRIGALKTRWLEIVFRFARLVLQILFQLQFGLSYQCEIYQIITSYFFQKTCYHGNDIMHSVAPYLSS